MGASCGGATLDQGRVSHAGTKLQMLSVQNVVKSFGGFRALNGCILEIKAGGITGIMGPNGAGKSTLFNVIAGLIPPDEGEIVLEGSDVGGLAPHRLAARGLVRTFQISRELGELTVLENMLLGQQRQSGERALLALLGGRRIREEEARAIEKARGLLEQVDLWHLANEPARNLSGGQKKLLEISRALMLDPKIILLDEPTAGVSPLMSSMLSRTISKLRDRGLTFAIIEHDMDMIAEICDPIYVLAEGRTLTSGTFREVAANADVMRAYLGKIGEA
jgi:ABC-type branched-subunit amino acid transport system ATPase component